MKTPQDRYDKLNTIRICGLKLNLKTDNDIISHLKSKKNKQGYIKNLVRKDIGNILILWTCRNGKDLIEALSMCKSVGLIFDYVNSNTIENLKKYGKQDNRKIYADIYLDDKALNVKDL